MIFSSRKSFAIDKNKTKEHQKVWAIDYYKSKKESKVFCRWQTKWLQKKANERWTKVKMRWRQQTILADVEDALSLLTDVENKLQLLSNAAKIKRVDIRQTRVR